MKTTKFDINCKWGIVADTHFRNRWAKRKRLYQTSADRRLKKRSRQAVKTLIKKELINGG